MRKTRVARCKDDMRRLDNLITGKSNSYGDLLKMIETDALIFEYAWNAGYEAALAAKRKEKSDAQA